MGLTAAGSIRINHLGDGDWIMRRAEGVFIADRDHAIARAGDDGQPLGGIVFGNYTGASMMAHMAGEGPGWCTRTLLWMAFHYAFVQLGCRKLIGPVRSNNYVALAANLRGGWRVEAVVRDVYPDADLLLLAMDRETCPWLRVKPHGWAPANVEGVA